MTAETMRAVVVTKPGGPEVLEVRTVPRPQLAEGQILIRVEAAGVNRPDVLQRMGFYAPPPGASEVPGLEVAGVVDARGPGASRFAEGDRVVALLPGGGYADFCVAAEINALPIPKGLSVVEAAAIPETFFTVWTNVFERGALKAGETLLVHGGTSRHRDDRHPARQGFRREGDRNRRLRLRRRRAASRSALMSRSTTEMRISSCARRGDGRARRRRHPRHGRRRLCRAQLFGPPPWTAGSCRSPICAAEAGDRPAGAHAGKRLVHTSSTLRHAFARGKGGHPPTPCAKKSGRSWRRAAASR